MKKILIVKLEEVLQIHQKFDELVWPLLDPLLSYVSHAKESVVQKMTRVYIGNGTMVDIQKC